MFSIKKVFVDSYRFYIKNFVNIIGVTAFVYFLSILFENVTDSIFQDAWVVGVIVSVFLGVLSVIIEIGYLKYFLKIISGSYAGIDDLLKYTHLFWRYILASIATMLLVFFGLIVLIVPGIYLMLRFLFVPIILVDHEVSVKEAFKKSSEITKGSKWKLLGFVITLALLQCLAGLLLFSNSGELVYGAGFVLMTPFLIVAFVKVYRSLSGLE